MANLDDVLAQLAAVPPGAFTRERNALVQRLNKAGQSEAAARVKTVPRPTAAVWAVNWLAREQSDSVERLIAATDGMRAAQLGRHEQGPDLAAANQEHRAALAHLAPLAEGALRQSGLGVTHQALLRVERTVAAAAADPALRAVLRQGRIERELAARGFEVFAGEKLPPARQSSPSTVPRQSSARAPREGGAQQAREQRDEGSRRDAQRALAEKELVRAEAAVADQQRQLQTSRERVAQARQALHEAERDARRAGADAERADKALAAARAAVRAVEKKSARLQRS